MKKTIRIDIRYPDCDFLNITAADLMAIQNEVLNQCSIAEDVAEGRFEIEAKIVEPINEEELDELAHEYVDNSLPLLDGDAISCFKAGYRKALEKYLNNNNK